MTGPPSRSGPSTGLIHSHQRAARSAVPVLSCKGADYMQTSWKKALPHSLSREISISQCYRLIVPFNFLYLIATKPHTAKNLSRLAIMDPLATQNHSSASSTLPAHFPPPGIVSNFVNNVTRATNLVVTSIVCICLVVICVSVPFYTKLHVRNAWGWDDCKPPSRLELTFTDSA